MGERGREGEGGTERRRDREMESWSHGVMGYDTSEVSTLSKHG